MRWLLTIFCCSLIVPLPPRSAAADETEDEGGSLTARLGLRVAERNLKSSEATDRLRALERLGTVGTARAVQVLVKALEPDGAARGARERLTAVRALAPHAHWPSARQALVRVLNGVQNKESETLELEELERQTAALALAYDGGPEALRSLGQALKGVGPAAEAARVGVIAYPPKDLRPFLAARGRPGTLFVQTLAEIGDQRAFDALRALVRRASPEVRAAAAVALTRLGDFETVALARHWLANDPSEGLRIAATRILADARADDAPAAIQTLLEKKNTLEAGIELAWAAPSSNITAALARLSDDPSSQIFRRALAAIGRTSTTEAAETLGRAMQKPEAAGYAAYALGLAPGEAAEAALVKLAARPGLRALALRAAAVRWARFARRIDGIEDAARAALGSKSSAERAAGALALAVYEPEAIRDLLRDSDPAIVRSAARTLSLAPDESARMAGARLAVERDPLTVDALALALAFPTGAAAVDSKTLVGLAERGGSASFLAARAMAERDEEIWRPTVVDWLRGGEIWLRAHVALGLGASKEPDAAALLCEAYRFEPHAVVRRSVVRALSGHQGALAQWTLNVARMLDPDPGVRSLARLAAGGVHEAPSLGGTGTAWFVLESGPDGGSATVALLTASGLALPVAADPDGIVIALGFPAGAVAVRVAAASKDGHAPSTKDAGDQENRNR